MKHHAIWIGRDSRGIVICGPTLPWSRAGTVLRGSWIRNHPLCVHDSRSKQRHLHRKFSKALKFWREDSIFGVIHNIDNFLIKILVQIWSSIQTHCVLTKFSQSTLFSAGNSSYFSSVRFKFLTCSGLDSKFEITVLFWREFHTFFFGGKIVLAHCLELDETDFFVSDLFYGYFTMHNKVSWN